ncbi:UNKNOWN [Stylonychia lemnae]|uniref:Uncharacterized protein n=1 Tax=Stylonychia lemnae TaxID=5949 RepID=A0A078B5U5_STYLE|nr:UNKNOWN [Stylonychia lemnae]|eukprot:CDW89870.1 UNKNOWN [Stylonychia lemnae]
MIFRKIFKQGITHWLGEDSKGFICASISIEEIVWWGDRPNLEFQRINTRLIKWKSIKKDCILLGLWDQKNMGLLMQTGYRTQLTELQDISRGAGVMFICDHEGKQFIRDP